MTTAEKPTARKIIKGRIAKIQPSTGEGQKGPWERWGVKLEAGPWLSTFEGAIGKHLVEGQEYTFEIEDDGQFKSIKTATAFVPVVAPTKPPKPPPGVAEAARLADIPMPGERETAIAQAHQENMVAHEELLRAMAYDMAVSIAVVQARISEDVLEKIEFLSMENIKKRANNYYLAIKAKL